MILGGQERALKFSKDCFLVAGLFPLLKKKVEGKLLRDFEEVVQIARDKDKIGGTKVNRLEEKMRIS